LICGLFWLDAGVTPGTAEQPESKRAIALTTSVKPYLTRDIRRQIPFVASTRYPDDAI
jgi:hypothetical protein